MILDEDEGMVTLTWMHVRLGRFFLWLGALLLRQELGYSDDATLRSTEHGLDRGVEKIRLRWIMEHYEPWKPSCDTQSEKSTRS